MQDVLLVTTDSLRADHVGHHGYDRDTTPFLDDLADRGSAFHEAYAHAGSTQYAFPSILTSVYPTMYGGSRGVAADQTLISEVFHDAGYSTGGFHSNLYLSSDFGYNRGWDEFYDSKPNSSNATKIRSWAKKALVGSPLYPYASKAYDYFESKTGVNVGSYIVPADETTDMALEHVRSLENNEPAFIWVHYMDPHHPFLPPEEYQLLFRDETVGKRESIKLRQKMMHDPESVTDKDLQKQLDLYDAETRFNDEQIERLVQEIRMVREDVTVAFTSDHGEHFLEHGHFGSAHLRNVKQHIPMLIEGPNWDDDGEYDQLVAHIDLPTTLVRHAGLDKPSNYHGKELQELIGDGTWDRDEIVGGYGINNQPRYAVRTRDWKYIWEEQGPERLFDLQEDPDEVRDVSTAHPDVTSKFNNRIKKHRERVRRTEADVRVEMDEEVKERLRRLGYKE